MRVLKKLLLFLLISVGINAQFNYQAIVKDSDGNIVTNNQVKFKFSLIYQSSIATPVFVEEHEVITPPYGVVNLSVGGGTVVNGTFSDLDWSQSVFMKEELDTGSGYQDMGTRKVASVPVAENSKKTSITSRTFIDENYNIFIGGVAQQKVDSNEYEFNIAIGQEDIFKYCNGNDNIVIGDWALRSEGPTDHNTVIGSFALGFVSGSTHNIAIGSYAGANVIGSGNIIIGNETYYDHYQFNNLDYPVPETNIFDYSTNVANPVFLGSESLIVSPSNSTIFNSVALGYKALVTASNTIQLGNVSVTLVNTSGVVSATGFKGSGDEITLTDNGTTNELIKIIDDLRNEIKNLKKEITECPIIQSAGYIGSDEPFDDKGEYVICHNTIPNIITPLGNSSPLTNGDATLSYYWQLSTDGFKTFTNIFEDSLEYQLPALDVTTQVRRVVEASINDGGATVCTKTSNILTFKIPDPLRITHDMNNGVFTAQVEGGTAPYTLTLFNNNQIIDQVVANYGKSYVGLTQGENYRLEVWGASCYTTEMTFTFDN